MKKIISVILVTVLILVLLASCGSPSSKIVGKWTAVTDDSRFSQIEFFSDSTYTSSDIYHSGRYSIDGNRIKLSGVLDMDIACDFEIKGNTLILDEDEYKREK